MHVEGSVRFFAAYRQVTGRGAATIRLPAGATVADLVARVMEAHPQLAAHRDSMILAVNREFADIGTELRAAAKSQFGVTEVAIVHRTGRLGLGETAMAIACGAPHRREALRACEWMIEELKTIVPIWKTER